MQYTLGQAKKRLAASCKAYGQDDLRDLINNAIQALSGMSGWECLRKVLRFSSAGPGFVLPQGCAGLVRACVNGRPTTVRGQDFRFIQSGPGELRRPPKGFMHVHADNVLDIGMKPVMREPVGVSRLFCLTVSGTPAGAVAKPLIVCGITPSGERVRRTIVPQKKPVYDIATGNKIDGVEPGEAELDDAEIQTITEVTVPEDAVEYYDLYACDYFTGARYPIAFYHPEVKAPQFRHYEITGIRPGQPIELLIETRVDPLPLVEDTDVLPFGSIEPIEWMIRADWQMKAGEVTAAKNYQDLAAKWLKAQEVTDDTIQTQVIVNSVFEGSPGEISMDSVNI